jgi:hypothetical protein
LIFTKNAKKGFFKNTTSFSQFWNADRAFADMGRSGNLESPTSSFQNSLSTIIPWKEKWLISNPISIIRMIKTLKIHLQVIYSCHTNLKEIRMIRTKRLIDVICTWNFSFTTSSELEL